MRVCAALELWISPLQLVLFMQLLINQASHLSFYRLKQNSTLCNKMDGRIFVVEQTIVLSLINNRMGMLI